jgi:hypothetical protein
MDAIVPAYRIYYRIVVVVVVVVVVVAIVLWHDADIPRTRSNWDRR